MRHDRWSKLGEDNLGEHNIRFAEIQGPNGFKGKLFDQNWGHDGFFTLMKCIMNDYWADIPGGTPVDGWPQDHVDMVMSKIYYCWVRMLDEGHPEGEDEE